MRGERWEVGGGRWEVGGGRWEVGGTYTIKNLLSSLMFDISRVMLYVSRAYSIGEVSAWYMSDMIEPLYRVIGRLVCEWCGWCRWCEWV